LINDKLNREARAHRAGGPLQTPPERGAVPPKNRIRPPWLTQAVSGLFVSAGLSEAGARTVAEALVSADLRGISSHGSMLVPMYVDRLLAGSVTTADRAEVVTDLGAIAVLDAENAMGILTGDQGMALAIDKARAHGVGAVVVRRAFHFGGAFRFVQAAAKAGCIGIAAANTRPLMPAPGGAQAVVGNNPLAFGVPRATGAPVVLDMALSEAALGKIRLAEAEGREIPPTWATDADGAPTTDATAAIAGLLLPMGGHKGYGLALMVDVLTGVLSGGSFGPDVRGLYADASVPNDCAHVFVALDAEAFGGRAAFEERVDALAAHATGSRRAPGVERLLMPGQLEDERDAQNRREGIPVDDSVLEALRRTAEKLGTTLPEPELVA
jgi:LDH2 family malate/lactate/ureidoglycolate dehydrogenase